MPFPVAAAALAGGSVLSSVLGGKGAKKAARAEERLGRDALALQERMFNTSRGDLMPWLEEGGAAIRRLGDMLEPGYDHTESPGYRFRLGEGLRAVENSAAARGILQSGGTLKGIDRYAEGLAADDFERAFNRTASVAAGGQQTGTTLGSLGASYAGQGSDTLARIGAARASGYAGQTAAWQQGLGSLASIAGGIKF